MNLCPLRKNLYIHATSKVRAYKNWHPRRSESGMDIDVTQPSGAHGTLSNFEAKTFVGNENNMPQRSQIARCRLVDGMESDCWTWRTWILSCLFPPAMPGKFKVQSKVIKKNVGKFSNKKFASPINYSSAWLVDLDSAQRKTHTKNICLS